jgi:hypothetical protein
MSTKIMAFPKTKQPITVYIDKSFPDTKSKFLVSMGDR